MTAVAMILRPVKMIRPVRVPDCARCGGDHGLVQPIRLCGDPRPLYDGDGLGPYDRFVICPETGQPVLLFCYEEVENGLEDAPSS